MVRIRAIVFDVGGTLIYPADPVGETYARLARAHGARLPAEETSRRSMTAGAMAERSWQTSYMTTQMHFACAAVSRNHSWTDAAETI